MDNTQVLLITGPAGSGKSTLAETIARLPGWVLLSEDEYWVRHGWLGHRSEDQERAVQQEVIRDLQSHVAAGDKVALEFILYKTPPNPLSVYIDQLCEWGVAYDVVVLKPDIETIIERACQRGRPDDLADLNLVRANGLHQLSCLEDDSIDPDWIINSAGCDADEVFEIVIRRFGMR